MTEKAKEFIQPYVRSLLKCVAHVEPGDDKFSQLEHYVFSNIWGDKFNAVDRYSVKKSIDGVIRKFFIHGLSIEAEKLQSLLEQFLNNKVWENPEQPDVRWHVLSLLLHLSYHPTGSTLKELPVVQPVAVEPSQEFDWPAYLLENQPDFISLGSDGSETEDECLSFDDEVPGECNSLTEDVATEANAGGGGAPVVAAAADRGVSDECVWSYIEGTLASARMWLEGNVVLPLAQGCRVPSKHPAANLAKFCGDAVENVGEQSPASMVAMSEHRVLREALRALVAPPPPKMTSETSGLFFLDQRGVYHPKGTVVIPSLTKGSVQSHLRWLGSYMSMVWELESFMGEISEASQKEQWSPKINATLDTAEGGEKGSCLPSFTYEAYASALRAFLFYFKEKVLAVEEKVKCQDSVCTLLSVAKELRPVFRKLELVYRTHLDAVCGWKESSNWLNSCRLLTVLYGALLSSFSDVSASIYFHLFTKAFHPYLEIIHTWLTEGHLEDWREEFIICRNELMCGDSENLWKEGFILRPYEEELSKVSNMGVSRPLGLLHLIRDKVLPLGKNMELLQRLDCLSEVQRSQPSFERSLYHELIYALKIEINDGFRGVATEKNDTSSSLSEEKNFEQSSLLKCLVLGIEGSKDYYLKMAFGDITCLEEKAPDSFTRRLLSQLGQDQGEGMEEVGKGFMAGVVPLRVGCLLGRLLEERHGASSVIVRTLLLGEFSVATHLLVVRRIYLMEEGDCMHHFCTQLFQQAEQGEKWEDSLSLTNNLLECISTRWPDYASNFSVLTSVDGMASQLAMMESLPSSSGSGGSHSVLEQVDHVHINYAVNWPVNIVLNASSLENYNIVFQFLLKVKWALWSLQQLRFCELKPGKDVAVEDEEVGDSTMPTSAKVHRLQLLRAWLLHFVGSVHAYLMGQVLHVLSVQMDADLEAACDLDSIIQVHENYMELMFQQCLQTKNSEIIKMAIIRVLDISMVLCKLWKQPAIITPIQLYDMESQYIRHHVFLARVLENAMNRGFVDHLKALVSALVHSFPSH